MKDARDAPQHALFVSCPIRCFDGSRPPGTRRAQFVEVIAHAAFASGERRTNGPPALALTISAAALSL
jgi:hypothetical protein